MKRLVRTVGNYDYDYDPGLKRGIGCSKTTTHDPQRRQQPTVEQTHGATQSERKRLQRGWGEKADWSAQ